MERLSINKNLYSDALVKFNVSGYMTEELKSRQFSFIVPKFPRRIDKSTVILKPCEPIYQPVSVSSSYTVLKYWFNSITDDSTNLEFILKIDALPTSVVKGDNIQFFFDDPAISRLHNETLQICRINRIQNNIVFKISTSKAYPRVAGDSASVASTNKIKEVTSTVIARKYVVSITDPAVTDYMENNKFIKHIPIFAYSQSIDNVFTANDDKYIMTPGTSNADQIISSSTPPAYSSISAFSKKTSNSSSIRKINTNGRYLRFYVAIAEYTRESLGDPWVGTWLQKHPNDKPIWKRATVKQ